jgi:hypothetical protein
MPLCGSCKVEKDDSSFHKSSRTGGVQLYCKSCRKHKDKAYWAKRAKNVEAMKAKAVYARALRDKVRKYLWDYLSCHPCVDCGNANILCLQFDHVRGEKAFSISQKAFAVSFDSLQEEIAKCEVRCANCHAIKTAKQLNWHKQFYRV